MIRSGAGWQIATSAHRHREQSSPTATQPTVVVAVIALLAVIAVVTMAWALRIVLIRNTWVGIGTPERLSLDRHVAPPIANRTGF